MDLSQILNQILGDVQNGNISPENIQKSLGLPGGDSLPSDDVIVAATQNLIDGLNPLPFPLSDSEINDLMCKYGGTELRNWIILQSLEKLHPGFIKENMSGFDFSQMPDPHKLENFINNRGLSSQLTDVKERMADHLPLNDLNIDFPDSNLKKRTLNLGLFSFSIEAITEKGIPKFFNVKADTNLGSVSDILKRLEKRMGKTTKKPCDQGGVDESKLLQTLKNLVDKATKLNERNKPVTDIFDQYFCEPEIPVNPDTGDPLFTPQLLKEYADSLCNPLPEDVSPENNSLPETPCDTSSISDCVTGLISAFSKQADNNDLLARYNKAENELQELLYHYRIIEMYYQKLVNLVVTPSATSSQNTNSSLLSLQQLVSQISILDKQIAYTETILSQAQTKYDADSQLFLNNNPNLTSAVFGIDPNIILTPNDLTSYLNNSISTPNDSVIMKDNNGAIKISVADASALITSNYLVLSDIYNQGQDIVKMTASLGNLISSKAALIPSINSIIGVTVTINPDGSFSFPNGGSQDYESTLQSVDTNSFTPSVQDFTSIYDASTNTSYQDFFNSSLSSGKGKTFLDSLNSFSCRFNKTGGVIDTVTGVGIIQFNIQYANGLGLPLPIETVKPSTNTNYFSEKTKVDIKAIQIGMEFSNGGIFDKSDTSFLSTGSSYFSLSDANPSLDKDKDFYSFFNEIANTNDTKDTIIQKIRDNRGSLYSDLIEVSSSPWLFFTSAERGDNDARKQQDVQPLPKDSITGSNPVFDDFWKSYKTKWNARYTERQSVIENEIANIGSVMDDYLSELTSLYSNFDVTTLNVAFSQVYADVQDKIQGIQNLLLDIGVKSSVINKSMTPEAMQALANSLSCKQCGTPPKTQKISCPPACCGNAGQGIVNHKPVDGQNASDCPTFYTSCYWKEFSKMLDKLGVLPYPSGIPPIEDPSLISGNISLKYWPVGYLPPAFIPLPPPLVNPLDGNPFIRIPLPMSWSEIDPMVIPLPTGILVVFIPFIGGFMPTPLIYYHDFFTGLNIFLLGLRGFRFIPRLKDPKIKDPLQRLKEYITTGMPISLFPFPNLGKDNMDNPDRLVKEMSSQISDMMANKKGNVNMDEIYKIQDEENAINKKYEDKILDAKRREALDGNSEYESLVKNRDAEISTLDTRKKDALVKSINDYVGKMVKPADLVYPKQEENLSVMPSGLKKVSDSLNLKAKSFSMKGSDTVNLKARVFRQIDDYIFIEDPAYTEQNKGLYGDQKIVASIPVELNSFSTSKESQDYLSGIIATAISDMSLDPYFALNPVSLGLYSPSFNFPSKNFGDNLAVPSSLNTVSSRDLDSITSAFNSLSNIGENESLTIENLSKTNGISGNKIIRERDLKKIMKKLFSDKCSSLSFDATKFKISNPATASSVATKFSSALAAFEPPPFPPRKSATPGMPTGPGGIPQVTIPGASIGSFVTSGVSESLKKKSLADLMPYDKSSFKTLSENDVKSISTNLVKNSVKSSVPSFISSLPSPPLKARPQDMGELLLSSFPGHPAIDLAYQAIWKVKTKGRIGINSTVVEEMKSLGDAIIYNIPWQVMVLLGRNVLQILDPLKRNEDLPRWDRLTLDNPYFAVFADEFLRSAADISGLFKFFLGQDLLYPLPDLEIPEIISKINTIIGVN